MNFAERALALALLALALPVIGVIALAIRLTAGAPIFYGGTRLGRGKRPFTMFKLRTLVVGASQVTGGALLDHRHGLMIRGGRFLRETRLDELPQLWNIVRGDMAFVGPRPERPEVFETLCREIPGYERRFDVRPGLIGVSQLFTPHGTPKRYRALIDNGSIRRNGTTHVVVGRAGGLGIVAYTIWVVLCETVRRLRRHLSRLLNRLSSGYRERRRLRRVAPGGARAHLVDEGGRLRTAQVIDMNEEALLVECAYEPGLEDTREVVLDIAVRGATLPARRTARCRGRVAELRSGPVSSLLVIEYRAASPCSEYMIHQYFLRGSLAPPRREWRGRPPELPAPEIAGTLALPAPALVDKVVVPATQVPPRKRTQISAAS